MLERLGYGVLAAGRADEALRLIERPGTAVDLLVADIVMPGMSGRELAVRALAQRPNLRVLLMSGYAPLQGDAALPGGFAFLPKPFSIETLARRVRETLAGPAPAALAPPA
jgi:DNA-binding NtrC family response regulator